MGSGQLLFTPADPGEPTLPQSRRGALYQACFPDLVATADQLPYGLVLDASWPSLNMNS